jgi:RimJ/RimL family protein N-acetyltransferase
MEIMIDPARLPQTVPLALYESHHIGSAENNDESFDVFLGLDEQMATRLRELSFDLGDTALQENTSDFKRFGEEGYEKWYAKGRVPFVLVHRNTGALAALVWLGPKPLGRKSLKHLSAEELKKENTVESGNWHTAVFRSYPPFRGTGVMSKFASAVTDVYMNYFPNAELWAGINRSNPASIKLAEKLGYQIDESISDDKWVGMVKK